MYIASPETNEIVIVKGAIIEYTKDNGAIREVKIHQPVTACGNDIHQIHNVIHEHLGEGYTLKQMPFECNGSVDIKTWKVIYE